jgi:rhodanese-related sulfurtransferase
MLTKWIVMLGVAASVMLPTVARAGDTPATLDGAQVVTGEDVVKLQAAGAVVIDARVASEYAESHIKGAVSVPYREKSAKAADFDAKQDDFNLAKLPADKTAPIVFACNGPECWKSYKASVVALRNGYKSVHWYRGGFPDWKSRNLPVE